MFVDAKKMAIEHPLTFNVPSDKEISKIKLGTNCKLCFDGKERMWVKVTEIKGPKHFIGILNNDPIIVENKCGDIIEFEARHIYLIFK